MRKTVAILFAFALVVALMPQTAAAGDAWTGWITDEGCGAKGANAEHKACALKCHSEGMAFVFYNNADEQLYKISDQEMAAEHLGHEVTVHGELEGDTITVASIEASGETEDDGEMEDEGMEHGDDHGHGDHGHG